VNNKLSQYQKKRSLTKKRYFCFRYS